MTNKLMANWSKTDPSSSRDAAVLMEECGLRARQTWSCYREVCNHPGLTAAELADRMRIERHIPSRRLPELRDAGYIRNEVGDDGKPKLRKCKVVNKASLTWWPTEKDPQGRLF